MSEKIELDAQEARVLGVLIEKSLTTPDQYPLTINSATLGANQKSNRHPVVTFSESEVESTLRRLVLHHLAGGVKPAGSRVEKFRHNAEEVLGVDRDGVAVLAELLLRGPQTAGELRSRASRMAKLESLDLLSRVLSRLIEHEYVERLPPASGSRAERYVQLLSPGLHEYEAGAAPSAPAASAAAPALAERVVTLEEEVAKLRRQLEGLAEKLGEPLEA